MARSTKEVIVVAHDSAWKHSFEAEAVRIARALGDLVCALHHIGSTAIPGICAKPIVDILLEVDGLPPLDAASPALADIGYVAKGEHGIPGRRYFSRDDAAGVRTHHLHAFARQSPHVRRHLAFRDYLIAYPDEARRYGALKQRLAREHPHDIEAYMAGKAPFIEERLARALSWWPPGRAE